MGGAGKKLGNLSTVKDELKLAFEPKIVASMELKCVKRAGSGIINPRIFGKSLQDQSFQAAKRHICGFCVERNRELQ